MYNTEHIEKIGNTIVFLTKNMENVSKTKLLKLLYILDEISIKNTGIPFLGLEYKVWKFGPVASDIFAELSSSPSMLKEFIDRKVIDDDTYIIPKKEFNDDEFSDNEIELLNFMVKNFKNSNTKELISFTHRKNYPWHNAAVKHNILEALENERISSTDIKVNMKELIEHDSRKQSLYSDYIETHSHNCACAHVH